MDKNTTLKWMSMLLRADRKSGSLFTDKFTMTTMCWVYRLLCCSKVAKNSIIAGLWKICTKHLNLKSLGLRNTVCCSPNVHCAKLDICVCVWKWIVCLRYSTNLLWTQFIHFFFVLPGALWSQTSRQVVSLISSVTG